MTRSLSSQRRRSWAEPKFWIGLGLSLLLVGLAISSWFWAPFPVIAANAQRFAPPGAAHWLGTDAAGRDMTASLLAGALTSLLIAAVAVGIGLAMGVALGCLAAIRGGGVDWLILRSGDFVLGFPVLITAILAAALVGADAINAVIAIGIVNVAMLARVVRDCLIGAMHMDYLAAARLAGLKGPALAWRHLLPSIAGAVSVTAAKLVALGLLGEAGLSFLGLGVQPPQLSLGLLLASAQGDFLAHPDQALLPGAAVVLLAFAFNLFADGLRSVLDLDPRLGGIARAAT